MNNDINKRVSSTVTWTEAGHEAREWYNKQKDVRWHFSPEQDKLIDKLLKVFEKTQQASPSLKQGE